MLLCAIDPGYESSHAVLFNSGDPVGGPPGVRRAWSLRNAELLASLRWDLPTQADLVLIESMDPFGMRLGRETMDTILWIGRFQEAGHAELVPRSLVKMTLCGNRKADDSAIRHVLIDRLGKPGTKKNPGPTYGVSHHLWQALAVAVTWLEINRYPIGGDALRNRSAEPAEVGTERSSASISNPAPGATEAPGAAQPPAPQPALFEEEKDVEA
jgi:hypothetical protein